MLSSTMMIIITSLIIVCNAHPTTRTATGACAAYCLSSHSVSLTRIMGAGKSALSVLQQTQQPATSNPLLSLRSNGFAVPIALGNNSAHSFQVMIDTGSADTWLAKSSFMCLGSFLRILLPQKVCGFGRLFDELSDATSDFATVDGVHFDVNYADGTWAAGDLASTKLMVAPGLTIPAQYIGIANAASWTGTGVESGLLGLGYSASTSAYLGADITDDIPCPLTEVPGFSNITNSTTCNQYNYPSVLSSLFDIASLSSSTRDGPASLLQSPIFTIAVSRDDSNNTNGGTLTFGGIPDISLPSINISDSTPFIATPILPYPVEPFNSTSAPKYTYYSVNISALTFSTDTDATITNSSIRTASTTLYNTPTIAIIDTGTTLSYLPHVFVSSFNAAFSPPATLNSQLGVYTVPCNATIPELGTTIPGTLVDSSGAGNGTVGEVTFWHEKTDLVIPVDREGFEGVCVSVVQDGDTFGGVYILGEAWLRKVLVVFDLGRGEIGLGGRRWYAS